MKNPLLKLSLAGILLGAGILNPLFAQKKERPHVSGTIQEVKYSDKTWKNNKFSLEEQVLFGKYDINDIPVILVKNEDLDKGELDFIVYKEDETEIQNIHGKGIMISGVKYIPTRLVDEDDFSIIKNFELSDIKGNLRRTFNKFRRKSGNSYGFSIDFTEKNINSTIPQIKVNGRDYACFDSKWGNFYSDNGKRRSVNHKDANHEENLSKLFVPIMDGYIEGINLGNGKIRIHSDEGFYIPSRERIQIEKNTPKKEQEKTDYMKYREQMERK